MSRKRPTFKNMKLSDDHGSEGIDILLGTASVSLRVILYIIFGLILSVLAWSFFATASVVVSVPGSLETKMKMWRVYSPTPGEIVDVYVIEGDSVERGAVLARIKSHEAVQAATRAEQAGIRLEKAEDGMCLLPDKKRLWEMELDNLKKRIARNEKDYALLQSKWLRQLPEIRKHQLEEIALRLKQAEEERNRAQIKVDKYQKLFESEDHGGISEQEMEDARNKLVQAEMKKRELSTEPSEMDSNFGRQDTEADRKVEQSYLKLLDSRFDYESKLLEIKTEEKEILLEHRTAKALWESAMEVTFDELDSHNHLIIKAPVSGLITDVTVLRPGEKIRPETPVAAIAPEHADMYLFVKIPEKDRGVLKIGQSARLKFSAFPFQRYGCIDGVLEYISPIAESVNGKNPVFEGRVKPEREYFIQDGVRTELRFGMTAVADINVQHRRLIDFAMDPLRKLSARFRSSGKS